jgi:hypothetical protein
MPLRLNLGLTNGHKDQKIDLKKKKLTHKVELCNRRKQRWGGASLEVGVGHLRLEMFMQQQNEFICSMDL